jgi:hypothetical protein
MESVYARYARRAESGMPNQELFVSVVVVDDGFDDSVFDPASLFEVSLFEVSPFAVSVLPPLPDAAGGLFALPFA